MRLLRRIVHTVRAAILRASLKRIYLRQQADPRGPNERTLEYAFALHALRHSLHQDILDVGSGTSPWPALLSGCGYHVTAIDKVSEYWEVPLLNRHFYVIREDITKPTLEKQFGIITCLSTLEHIPQHGQAVASMARLLKPDGVLILSFPYNERKYVENVYALPEAGYGRGNPYVCQVFSRVNLADWQAATGLEIREQHYYQAFTGELWTFGKRLRPMREVSADQPHHLTGLVLAWPNSGWALRT